MRYALRYHEFERNRQALREKEGIVCEKNLLCSLLVFYLGNVVPVCVIGVSSNVFCIGGNRKYIAQEMDGKVRTPFNGGLIPGYTLPKERKLPDPIRALALPGAVQGYYTVLMLNFFARSRTPWRKPHSWMAQDMFAPLPGESLECLV